jgi:uncharacterized protein (DUF2267 family)
MFKAVLSPMETRAMTTETGKAVAEAYRWQRRLGNQVLEAACCHIVANPSHPQVWDANHADAVTARTDVEIASVFAAMEAHLGHTPWRVVHTDGFTPDAFLGRLALAGFQEQPVTIQMVLQGVVAVDADIVKERDATGLLEPAKGPVHCALEFLRGSCQSHGQGCEA